MSIHIEALNIIAIIGILDFERTTAQQIFVDAQIDYLYKKDIFINYAEVITLIETCLVEEKYALLEDALNDIQQKILNTYPQILRLTLKITKPNIIKNAKVALSLKWVKSL